jgi:hypothetical protein
MEAGMDFNQLIIALIGALSTLLAAFLSSRAKQKPGVTPSRRSVRKTVFKFVFYFILGGGATYYVMFYLLPFGRIEERLTAIEANPQSFITRMGLGGTADSMQASGLPVGSLVLSTLSPGQFRMLPADGGAWVPADGRMLDTTVLYVRITGRTSVPSLGDLGMMQYGSSSVRDSSLMRPASVVSPSPDSSARTQLYWYIRVN